MARDMCANIMMEEGYMRMTVEYNNEDSKKKIQLAIGKVEKELKIFPSVLRRAISEHAGNFSIEFGYESCQRTAGEFFELLMKEVGIGRCEI